MVKWHLSEKAVSEDNGTDLKSLDGGEAYFMSHAPLRPGQIMNCVFCPPNKKKQSAADIMSDLKRAAAPPQSRQVADSAASTWRGGLGLKKQNPGAGNAVKKGLPGGRRARGERREEEEGGEDDDDAGGDDDDDDDDSDVEGADTRPATGSKITFPATPSVKPVPAMALVRIGVCAPTYSVAKPTYDDTAFWALNYGHVVSPMTGDGYLQHLVPLKPEPGDVVSLRMNGSALEFRTSRHQEWAQATREPLPDEAPHVWVWLAGREACLRSCGVGSGNGAADKKERAAKLRKRREKAGWAEEKERYTVSAKGGQVYGRRGGSGAGGGSAAGSSAAGSAPGSGPTSPSSSSPQTPFSSFPDHSRAHSRLSGSWEAGLRSGGLTCGWGSAGSSPGPSSPSSAPSSPQSAVTTDGILAPRHGGRGALYGRPPVSPPTPSSPQSPSSPKEKFHKGMHRSLSAYNFGNVDYEEFRDPDPDVVDSGAALSIPRALESLPPTSPSSPGAAKTKGRSKVAGRGRLNKSSSVPSLV